MGGTKLLHGTFFSELSQQRKERINAVRNIHTYTKQHTAFLLFHAIQGGKVREQKYLKEYGYLDNRDIVTDK